MVLDYFYKLLNMDFRRFINFPTSTRDPATWPQNPYIFHSVSGVVRQSDLGWSVQQQFNSRRQTANSRRRTSEKKIIGEGSPRCPATYPDPKRPGVDPGKSPTNPHCTEKWTPPTCFTDPWICVHRRKNSLTLVLHRNMMSTDGPCD